MRGMGSGVGNMRHRMGDETADGVIDIRDEMLNVRWGETWDGMIGRLGGGME